MALVDDMTGLERRLQAVGKTVGILCGEAGIARSTWDRWKRGETEPNFKTWRGVCDACERLAPVSKGEAA